MLGVAHTYVDFGIGQPKETVHSFLSGHQEGSPSFQSKAKRKPTFLGPIFRTLGSLFWRFSFGSSPLGNRDCCIAGICVCVCVFAL